MLQRVLHTLAFCLTGLMAAGIAYVMLLPPETGTAPFPHFDKALHALVFALLVLPLCTIRPRHARWMLPVGLLFGAAIEAIQPQFGRGAEWLDLAADGAGLILGFACARFLNRLFIRR
ncbi:MAG: VanZ family protein [Pseudomonadota bacterium]